MALMNTRLAQAIKPRTEINEMQSLQLTRNLVRIAISEISYIRGLFPDTYFHDRYLPALEMNVKKLMPLDLESTRLIDWMEKGVYDALQKKYLETLLFRLCDGEHGPLIEEYAFSFRYDISSEHVSMDITRSNSLGAKGKTWKMVTDTSDLTPAQMKAAACRMIRTLVQLMRTLNSVPEQRTIIMQLYYHADRTPADYEPPFFRSCTYEDTKLWAKKPLIMKVGNMNSKHCEVSLKVRSILDPCEDNADVCIKSDDKRADEFSSTSESDVPCTSRDFASRADAPCSGSEHTKSLTIPDPDLKKSARGTSTTGTGEDVQQVSAYQKSRLNDDITQDCQSMAYFASAIKEWAVGRQSSTFDDIDILANFPQIPATFLEELVSRLVKDRFMEKAGEDKYRVTNFQGLIQLQEHDLGSSYLPEDVGLNVVTLTAEGRTSACASPSTTPRRYNLRAKGYTCNARDENLSQYEKGTNSVITYLFEAGNLSCTIQAWCNNKLKTTNALKIILRLKQVTVRELTRKLGELGESVNPSLINQLVQRMGKEGYVKITPAGSSREIGRPVLRPLQECEDHLQQIVDAVKEVVIAEADDSENESISDETKVELRTKSRADLFSISNCEDNPEWRSKSRNFSASSPLNAYERRGKKKQADLCAKTRSNAMQEVSLPDVSTTERALHPPPVASHNAPSQKKRVDLPVISLGGSNPQDINNDSKADSQKSHNRVRKASKVEEPIHQSLNSKRMRP